MGSPSGVREPAPSCLGDGMARRPGARSPACICCWRQRGDTIAEGFTSQCCPGPDALGERAGALGECAGGLGDRVGCLGVRRGCRGDRIGAAGAACARPTSKGASSFAGGGAFSCSCRRSEGTFSKLGWACACSASRGSPAAAALAIGGAGSDTARSPGTRGLRCCTGCPAISATSSSQQRTVCGVTGLTRPATSSVASDGLSELRRRRSAACSSSTSTASTSDLQMWAHCWFSHSSFSSHQVGHFSHMTLLAGARMSGLLVVPSAPPTSTFWASANVMEEQACPMAQDS
mmetsp:Transcript_7630/g.19590  ORF Transcript_7630/g.19590 Transcript_7630/m.19590 type:complete len:290 (+) Transcript_7630:355-1224(+)